MTTDLDIQLTATSDCPLVGVVMGAYGTLYLGARALGLSWGDVGGLVRLLLGG